MQRRWWRALGAILYGALASHAAFAQVDLQKFKISKLTLKFVTNKPSTNRCLLWFPFNEPDPVTEFDDQGKPFTRAHLRARVRGKDCNVSFRPQEVMKLVKQQENDLFFEVIVRPPVTIVDFTGFFNGPDFKDQLIFDATSDELADIDFFNFFRKSKVYFESRYTSLSTNNPSFTGDTSGDAAIRKSVNIVPVFGGKIGIPFPWYDKVVFDFSMFQNLGNLKPSDEVGVQYSEFALGVSYIWSGRESWGRPQIIPSVDYRGRNIYQTFVNLPNSTDKPFLLGSLSMPGVGVDMSWYPGAAWYPWEHWMSRIGIDLSGRYYFGGKVGVTAGTLVREVAATQMLLDIGLQYRLSRKWALGVGWSRITAGMDYPGSQSTTHIEETMNNFFLRLILVPYLPEASPE